MSDLAPSASPGSASHWRATRLATGVLALLLGNFACSESAPTEAPVLTPQAKRVMPPPFADVTEASQLGFVHSPFLTGEFYMPEIMGSGAALFDYDLDGDLDVYLVQGAPLTDKSAGGSARDQLYQNQWMETGRLEFVNVTQEARLSATGYGMGVAIGDYDADGFSDVLVTNFGRNELWRNLGNGEFEEVSQSAGLRDDDWSSSAAFLDIDNDADLDLYVANYVVFSGRQNFRCTSESGLRDYCGPDTYNPVPDTLWVNTGGQFEDRTEELGLLKAYGPGLGVAVSDFDGNGYVDIYVANDGAANQMWMNSEQGFTDNGLMSGTSLNGAGVAEAGMGVMAGDFDRDGDDDLFMTHLIAETNTLYLNAGDGQFYDATSEVNLAAHSLPMTGFGAGWIDFDSDTYLDLFVANGNVKLEPSRAGKSDYPFEQANQLFHNRYRQTGHFEFVEVSDSAPDVFGRLEVSRGAAFGDLNNDGAVDIVVTNNNGPARVLLNTQPPDNWLGVQVRHPQHLSTDGAVVSLWAGDKQIDRRTLRRTGSYLSSHDARVQLIPGESSADVHVRIDWPDGTTDTWPALENARYHVLEHGGGRGTHPAAGRDAVDTTGMSND